MNSKVPLTALTCALTLYLSGCSSSSTPSSREGKAEIEQRIKEQSNGMIKLVSFDKTDGQPFEAFGIKGYRLLYKAEIEFLDNCAWSAGQFGRWEGNFQAVHPKPTSSLQSLLPEGGLGMTPVKKGERTSVSGEVVFAKSENGWQVQR
jgi:hypothetical protein